MNNPVYLGLSVLELSKTANCKTIFWYNQVKPKYNKKAELNVFKKVLVLQIISQRGHYQKEKTKKLLL